MSRNQAANVATSLNQTRSWVSNVELAAQSLNSSNNSRNGLEGQDDAVKGLKKADTELQSYFSMPELPQDAAVRILENALSASRDILRRLQNAISEHHDDVKFATRWSELIRIADRQSVRPQTILGFVGNTGSGKSSIVNAILEEEQLVPTNCVRACTSVVTEISYNTHAIPYRAEVEFISVEDWKKELEILFQDLLGRTGQMSVNDTSRGDTEEGVAYAKIKAVYPELTKESLSSQSIEDLIKHPNVAYLGTTYIIENNDASTFCKKLGEFVDSKKKVASVDAGGYEFMNESSDDTVKPAQVRTREKKPKGEWKKPSHWPLIRVVRLFVKSVVLRDTGAVLVDLPGVQDSNLARAQVAEKYLQQCTGLFIVSTMHRAVDEKTARDLLGTSFKRQLKMDGGFSAVTFICSKTDQITQTNVSSSLDMPDEFDVLQATAVETRQELARQKCQLDNLISNDITGDSTNEKVQMLFTWLGIKQRLGNGETVFRPSPKKRKRTEVETIAAVEPLTIIEVNAEITNVQSFLEQDYGVDQEEESVRNDIHALEVKLKRTTDDLAAMCIGERNLYAARAIRQDFADGIHQMDEEAMDQQKAADECTAEHKDYDEIARNLPVFTVSSHAFQKLCGRFVADPDVVGFNSVADTQIPQLQKHCQALTSINRTMAGKAYWASLSQLLNSLSIWAESGQIKVIMTDEEHNEQKKHVEKHLELLEEDLKWLVRGVRKTLSTIFENSFSLTFQVATVAAVEEAMKTVLKWSRPTADGGCSWSTYKALCRRAGGNHRQRDWNKELVGPMTKKITPDWARAFTRNIPLSLRQFQTDYAEVFRNFHRNITIDTPVAHPGTMMLDQQLSAHHAVLKSIIDGVEQNITTKQRHINRQFARFIRQQMEVAYDECAEECGLGMYNRMKKIMQEHVERVRDEMFSECVKNVSTLLGGLVSKVDDKLGSEVKTFFATVRTDYTSALIGSTVSEAALVSDTERALRATVKELLIEAQASLHKAIDDCLTSGVEIQSEDPSISAGLHALKTQPSTGMIQQLGSLQMQDAAKTPNHHEVPIKREHDMY